jgi:hypothetical protein
MIPSDAAKSVGELQIRETRWRVYVFFVEWMRDHVIPPTLRDIMGGLDIKSTSVANYHLKHLSKIGLISRERRRYVLAKGIDHEREIKHLSGTYAGTEGHGAGPQERDQPGVSE